MKECNCKCFSVALPLKKQEDITHMKFRKFLIVPTYLSAFYCIIVQISNCYLFSSVRELSQKINQNMVM